MGDWGPKALLLPLLLLRGGQPALCSSSWGDTMTERFEQISYASLPEAVRPLADDILKVSSAALGAPTTLCCAALTWRGAPLTFWITCVSERR